MLDFRVSGSPASRSVKFPVCSSFVFRVPGVSASSCAVARCGRRGYSYCRACRNVRSGVKFPVAEPVASFGKSCEKVRRSVCFFFFCVCVGVGLLNRDGYGTVLSDMFPVSICLDGAAESSMRGGVSFSRFLLSEFRQLDRFMRCCCLFL